MLKIIISIMFLMSSIVGHNTYAQMSQEAKDEESMHYATCSAYYYVLHTYFSRLKETQESLTLASIMKSRAQGFILISGQLTSPEIAQYMFDEAGNEMARMINLDLNKISILNDKYGPYCKPLLDRQGRRMR